MRVSAETKTRTREEIVQVSRELFAHKGFEATTTRDIAAAAGIGVGTLFNYFPTKESLALHMIGELFDSARKEFHRNRRGDEKLDELLFAHAAIMLRHLRRCARLYCPYSNPRSARLRNLWNKAARRKCGPGIWSSCAGSSLTRAENRQSPWSRCTSTGRCSWV